MSPEERMISDRYETALREQAVEILALRQALLTTREGNQLGTHLSHCNLGEHVGACKYGDDACPALTDDWRWIGEGLTTARERVAELEAEVRIRSKWCEEKDAVIGRAGLSIPKLTERAEQAEARIAQLEALISPHDLPPTADRSAPDGEPDPALLATLRQQVFGTDPHPRPSR